MISQQLNEIGKLGVKTVDKFIKAEAVENHISIPLKLVIKDQEN
ncbi:D-ribose-binding periplasmic protein precursor (fragment) [Bartonella clarridgeiae 73]|uniref:D-ribose-binding periplasmic protein n=1 Tax=Bartonella clarridgeiae (strain CCUG 45776 / CIP 104772 / 73) TaxID=696125 RepID=E6YIL2_BARC7